MKIKFLKAGSGDCILIHTNGQNILIDGGDNSDILFQQIDEIYNNGKVLDLLVITHHDQDHIKGVLELLRKVGSGVYGDPKRFIKKVYFNSPRKILSKDIPEDINSLSYIQAFETEKIISKLQLDWETCTEESALLKFGRTTLKFLSPRIDDIQAYSSAKGAYLTNEARSDWSSDLEQLKKHVDDISLDKSIPNLTSIVILVEHKSKKILLTGDVTPSRFSDLLNALTDIENGQKLTIDYLKLPHHGSYKSISKDIFERIQCSNYIISTNSKKYKHPNKRAIVKVLCYSNITDKPIRFFFNHGEIIDLMNISFLESERNNFQLIPNNKDYGIELSNF
jgi:ribonuclease BN (tRNA processing enzyme)